MQMFTFLIVDCFEN